MEIIYLQHLFQKEFHVHFLLLGFLFVCGGDALFLCLLQSYLSFCRVLLVTIHTASLVVTLNIQITASGNADFLSIAQNFDSHWQRPQGLWKTLILHAQCQKDRIFFFWYFNRKLVQSISFKIMELINLLARALINWWFVIFDFFKIIVYNLCPVKKTNDTICLQ